MDQQDAYLAARDARNSAATELAYLVAYGPPVDHNDPLAITFRAANDALDDALVAWTNANLARASRQ